MESKTNIKIYHKDRIYFFFVRIFRRSDQVRSKYLQNLFFFRCINSVLCNLFIISKSRVAIIIEF